MRRALLASPLCAALAVLPGPCTTFDDVSAPTEDAGLDATPDDHAAPDAADAGPQPLCEGGVRFAFEPDGAGCQELIDDQCCIFEVRCEGDDACAAWVACVNACPPPRGADSGCLRGCGSSSSFSKVLGDLNDCRAALDAETRCRWP